MKIVTFNIRCVWSEGDGVNSFIHRAGMILDKISKEKPDVVAFQEITGKMVEFLDRHLTDYTLLGHGRGEDYTGEGVFTAIRKDSVQLIGLQVFWMTNTPYKCSLLPEQSLPRTCTATLLKDKRTGKLIRVYNAHLDLNANVRLGEVKVISETIRKEQEKIKLPFVFLGDFNAEPDTAPIVYLNNDFSEKIVDVTHELEYTFHAFNPAEHHANKIDYIYFDEETAKTAKNLNVWDDEIDGIYLSDHYPISVEIEL